MPLLDANLVAGVVAGAATALALHPLDTVKVRLQVADGVVHAARPAGLLATVTDMWRAEGAGVFYRGLGPALVGAGASWGLYFFFYEAAKRRLEAAGGGARLTPAQHGYAAWEGGTLTTLLTNPVWLVKTRMQVEARARAGAPAGAAPALAPYTSLRGALASILREDGVRGLYRGLAPALLLTSHGVVQFTAYEFFKAAAAPPGGGALDARAVFAAGAASKVLATLATYPYQVAKSRLQQRFAGAPAYAGLLDCAAKIARREGARGFYKGFAANLLRVAPQSALTLVVYEAVKSAVEAAQA
jgi:solute carrier family 25 folate transporter 32